MPTTVPQVRAYAINCSSARVIMSGMQDDCCGPSRRQLLRLASAGAAGGMILPMIQSARVSAASGTDGSGLYVQDLELITVTDTSFVLTWYTASTPPPAVPYDPDQEPAPVVTDGVVRYGTDPDSLDREAREHGAGTA